MGNLPLPISVSRVAYTGTVNGPGAANFTVPILAINDYRVRHVDAQLSSTEPTMCQMMVQGEDTVIPGSINLCSQQIRRLRQKTPSSEGYWSGSTATHTVAILNNLGKSPVIYNILVTYEMRYRATVPTALEEVRAFPQ